MKFIKLFFPIFDNFKELFGPFIKYDFISHLGIFILYNLPFLCGLLCLFIIEFIFGNIFAQINNYTNAFSSYFYDGDCIIGGNPMWKVHLSLNVLIFLYVFFKLRD
jgi:hypothetical protein